MPPQPYSYQKIAANPNLLKIKEALREGPKDTKQVSQATGIGIRTVRQWLTYLNQKGRVKKTLDISDGRRIVYTLIEENENRV